MLDAAALQAKADVELYLGTQDDDSDTVAVAQGARLMILELRDTITLNQGAKGDQARKRVYGLLERYAESKQGEAADPVFFNRDFTDLDTRYPASSWEDQDSVTEDDD